MEALAQKFRASWFSSVNVMAVPLRRYMEVVLNQTELPSSELQVLFASFADAGTQVHNGAFKPTDEQCLDHFPIKRLRARMKNAEGTKSGSFLSRASKPARVSFEGMSICSRFLYSQPGSCSKMLLRLNRQQLCS